MGRTAVAIRESRLLPSIPGIENLSPAVRYLIAFAIIFMLLALFALVLRRLTGARLTLASDRGRARQPRLGIVDVYDLDRHRQLILLRRDNVEHLLLVGGPNDVVVETNIVRVPGARLPASAPDMTERLEAVAAERPPDIAPVRPVVETPPVRPAARQVEPVVAGHLGRAETAAAAMPTPLRPATPRGETPARPVLAAGAGSARSPDRSRATPVPPGPQAAGGVTRAPLSGPRNASPAATGPREPEPAPSRPGLSDMARQLEDVLKRPETPPPTPLRPAPEPVRDLAPNGPQAAPGPQPVPDQRAEPRGTPRSEPAAPTPDMPAPTPPVAASSPDEPTSPPTPEQQRPSVQTGPTLVPPAARPADNVPPRAAGQAPATPEPPPAPLTPPRPDPFSIEDIEAEFARLLGRPLDRKDGKS